MFENVKKAIRERMKVLGWDDEFSVSVRETGYGIEVSTWGQLYHCIGGTTSPSAILLAFSPDGENVFMKEIYGRPFSLWGPNVIDIIEEEYKKEVLLPARCRR